MLTGVVMAERLQKYLARCGVASRRQAEVMIVAGQVTVNGQRMTRPGVTVELTDEVKVNGKIVRPAPQLVYYALHKPAGVVTTSKDEKGRQTVLDFVPRNPRVVACGRLDAPSRGLVILTNDGDLCYQLTHPSADHEKEYQVTAVINRGPALEERFDRLERGISLTDGLTQPTKITEIKRQNHQVSFQITLKEGRNRQVRRMCSAVGLDVTDLQRVRVAQLKLDNLPPGKWRLVKREDIL